LASMWKTTGPGEFVTPSGPGSDRDFETPTMAFHSTSVDNGAKVIKSGGLKKGVAASDGAAGYVYVEKDSRRHLSLRYATVTLCQCNPALATCAVLELCVDRGQPDWGVRSVVRGQWVQEEHRIFITGVFTHVFPIAQLYAKGFLGWARIHNSVITALQNLQVDDHGRTWVAKTTDEEMD